MAVWAVSMVRDEADIVAATVGNMLRQVDRVLVADNGSVDGTREILEQLDGVTVVDDPEPGYYQSRKISALAARAVDAGASWVLPFDADEMWITAHPEHSIAETLESLPANVLVVEAMLFDHVATAADGNGSDPTRRMGWRRAAPAPLRKVACRAVDGLWIEQGNHAARFPGVPHAPTVTNALEVRHYPYRSAEQFIRKARNGAAAYAATDLPEDVGAHWRGYGRILETAGPEALADVFRTWFWSADPAGDSQLVWDPCPASR